MSISLLGMIFKKRSIIFSFGEKIGQSSAERILIRGLLRL